MKLPADAPAGSCCSQEDEGGVTIHYIVREDDVENNAYDLRNRFYSEPATKVGEVLALDCVLRDNSVAKNK